MSCFMGYNPLVAKEVKITTWIKEFDGDSPVYPSFPNEGDCFVVFATDEDALTHNALSKKTYTNGDWADAEGGSTPTGTIKITENGEGIDVSQYALADVNVSGGGGMAIPTFSINNSSAAWSCDMTLTEIETSISTNGGNTGTIPCKCITFDNMDWKLVSAIPKAVLEEMGFVFDDDVTKCVAVYIMENDTPHVFVVMADNGKFYT